MAGSRFKKGNPGYDCCPVDCAETCFRLINGCSGEVASGGTVEVYRNTTCGTITITVLDCDTGVPLVGFLVSLYELPDTITPVGGGTTDASGQVALTGWTLGASFRIRTAKSGQGDWTTGDIGPITCNASITIRHQTDAVLGKCATDPVVSLSGSGVEVLASGEVDEAGEFCVDLSAYEGESLYWNASYQEGCFIQPSGVILGDPCGRTIEVVFLADTAGSCPPYHCGSRFCCSACPDCTIPGRLRLYDRKFKTGTIPPLGTILDCGDCQSLEVGDVEVVLQYSRYPEWQWLDCDPTSLPNGTGWNRCNATYRLTCEGGQLYLASSDILTCSWSNFDAYNKLISFWRCCIAVDGECVAFARSWKIAASTFTCNPFSATFSIPEGRADCFSQTVDPVTGLFSEPVECPEDLVLPARTITILPD